MSGLAAAQKIRRTNQGGGPPAYVCTQEQKAGLDYEIFEKDGQQYINLLNIPFNPTDSRNPNWQMCSRVNNWDKSSREESPTFFGPTLQVDEGTVANVMASIDLNLLYQDVDEKGKTIRKNVAPRAETTVQGGGETHLTKAEEKEVGLVADGDEGEGDTAVEDPPTEAPAEEPAEAPEEAPTEEPTEAPAEEPTEEPVEAPQEGQGEEEHASAPTVAGSVGKAQPIQRGKGGQGRRGGRGNRRG